MSKIRFVLVLFGVALTTLAAAIAAVVEGAPALPASEDDATRFIVLGDTGTGQAGQYAVKDAFLSVCATRGCDFAMINGDLIYETGVSSIDDPQFATKFEDPYADVPFNFYLTLGNHDNSADVDEGTGTDAGKGDIMVAYHYREDTSGKWYLPARYYSVRVGGDCGSVARTQPAGCVGNVELFSLDTNTMMSYGVTRNGMDPLETANGMDPALAAQGAWIDEALAASEAPWKIAFGHHPLYSNGEHGNAGAYESQGQTAPLLGTPFPTTLGLGVKAFLEDHVCDQADLYLAGHDHDLQWLEPQESCGATELLVSGAGAKSRELQDPDRNAVRFQQGGTLGFWWIEARGDSFTAAVYDVDANLLFERTMQKPIA